MSKELIKTKNTDDRYINLIVPKDVWEFASAMAKINELTLNEIITKMLKDHPSYQPYLDFKKSQLNKE